MTTPDEFVSALDRADVNAACPACSTNSWEVGDADFALVRTDDLDETIKRTLNVRPMVCGNCGFVRLHNTQALLG